MSLNSVQMMPACISVIRNVGSGGSVLQTVYP